MFRCQSFIKIDNKVNKEALVELTPEFFIISHQYKEQLDGGKTKTVDKVLFEAKIDTLVRVAVLKPFQTGKLILTFYFEHSDSYRDI